MPKYMAKVSYDMGMSMGEEVIEFNALNDKVAILRAQKLQGGLLSLIKRDVDVEWLARMIDISKKKTSKK